MKILLHGCNGRMGQVITRLVEESQKPESLGSDQAKESHGPGLEIICGVDLNPQKFNNSYPVYQSLDKVPADEKPDVLVDFSHHKLPLQGCLILP